MGREYEDPVLAEYARLAAQYDCKWSFYIDATTRETLKRICPHPGDALLDVGCGTGTLLQALSSAFPSAKLTGIDPSSAMLDVARAKLGPATGRVRAAHRRVVASRDSCPMAWLAAARARPLDC